MNKGEVNLLSILQELFQYIQLIKLRHFAN